MSDIDVYKRALEREKQARLDAEQELEHSTRKLYQQNQALQRQQAAMLKNEKLATIGMLSAGVAHEINNPLAVVISNLNALTNYNKQLLQLLGDVERWHEEGNLPAPLAEQFQQLNQQADFEFIAEDAPDMMLDMQDGLHRVQDIVSNLKSFSRTQPGERQSLDVNACIQASLKLVNNAIKDHCEVSLDLQPLPETAGNNSELSQVFMNLLINAAHAAKENGHITVRSKLDTESGEIDIQVQDNGCGIPENVIKDIFNPFFTTKPPGQGTGMGLAVAHGIITDHSGSIRVVSKEGAGTRFTIRLPVVALAAKDEAG